MFEFPKNKLRTSVSKPKLSVPNHHLVPLFIPHSNRRSVKSSWFRNSIFTSHINKILLNPLMSISLWSNKQFLKIIPKYMNTLLFLKVKHTHFANGDLKLKCTATISTVYWKSNEESVQGSGFNAHTAPVSESRGRTSGKIKCS